jgi:hypothetical protein
VKTSQPIMTDKQKKLIMGMGEIKPTSGVMVDFPAFCRETDEIAKEMKKDPRRFYFSKHKSH